mmetsp:Transcript_63245/g.200076  ORF Transcript_63245/g.200076 Transcript_63245/m.200076 type:complete len:221 (-) Transcript_63245:155-817(-)
MASLSITASAPFRAACQAQGRPGISGIAAAPPHAAARPASCRMPGRQSGARHPRPPSHTRAPNVSCAGLGDSGVDPARPVQRVPPPPTTLEFWMPKDMISRSLLLFYPRGQVDGPHGSFYLGGRGLEVAQLAAQVGKEVYLDMNGWHIYLKDMRFNKDLAGAIHSLLVTDGYDRDLVPGLLKKVPISLGAGKVKLSLYDCMPNACVDDMCKIVEDFADDM